MKQECGFYQKVGVQVLSIRFSVAIRDSNENEKTGADLGDSLSIYHHFGIGNSLNDESHGMLLGEKCRRYWSLQTERRSFSIVSSIGAHHEGWPSALASKSP